jgi:helicase
MPIDYPTEIVQPMGNHNSPYPCVRSIHIKKYMDFPFEFLNPVQSDFIKYLEDHETNIVLAAPTSSGKTKCIEFFIAEAIQNFKKKALYIAPMKALADEIYDDWTIKGNPFSKYKVEIKTGDFELNEEKKKKLVASDIIILTPEMFNSKCRFYSQHEWLKNTVFVGDEIHLIGMKDRGDALEVGLIQYFENDSKARALFVSATIPNVNDFKDWLEHLTGRKAVTIISNYRPCKLNERWVPVSDTKGDKIITYAEKEVNRTNVAVQQIQAIKDHPVIVFVGSKEFGYKLTRQLNLIDIPAHFHNADIEREKRKEIEKGFRELEFKVLVSTTTNAWGVNLPARYVIITHTEFGMTPMDPSNIHQSMGRAGRAGYASEGDAIILCERRKLGKEKERIHRGYSVSSTLNDVNTLCFHILSYLVNGHVKNSLDLVKWYKKTLAFIQNPQINEVNAQKVLDNLSSRGMIKFDKESQEYTATRLGDITARMYMSPLDVSDWFKNFSRIPYINPPRGSESTENGKRVNFHVALCLSECYQWGRTWFSNKEKEYQAPSNTVYISKREADCSSVIEIGKRTGLNPSENPHLKYTACLLEILNNEDSSPELTSFRYSLTKDAERIIQTLKQIDEQVGKHAKLAGKCKGFNWGHEWDILESRLKYGVGVEMVELVRIDGIGRSFAQKLYEKGIKTKKDLKSPTNLEKVEKILGKNRSKKIIESL